MNITTAATSTNAATRAPSLHNPVRGENEDYSDYCERRRVSNAATHARWLSRNGKDRPHIASYERLQRRDAVAAVGIRQFKRQRASKVHGLRRY